jgi:hypothetical protein
MAILLMVGGGLNARNDGVYENCLEPSTTTTARSTTGTRHVGSWSDTESSEEDVSDTDTISNVNPQSNCEQALGDKLVVAEAGAADSLVLRSSAHKCTDE